MVSNASAGCLETSRPFDVVEVNFCCWRRDLNWDLLSWTSQHATEGWLLLALIVGERKRRRNSCRVMMVRLLVDGTMTDGTGCVTAFRRDRYLHTVSWRNPVLHQTGGASFYMSDPYDWLTCTPDEIDHFYQTHTRKHAAPFLRHGLPLLRK